MYCHCRRLRHLLSLQPNDEKAYFNLGMIAMDDARYSDAEKSFRMAIQVSGAVDELVHDHARPKITLSCECSVSVMLAVALLAVNEATVLALSVICSHLDFCALSSDHSLVTCLFNIKACVTQFGSC